ncbi:hypothetical protein BSPWISOXPB_8051 [uncultured Gammaproteobacteria bacterium]|nr:hypothetical protein BSPWISOXPB_8051 [uncultured Gammaproteobacteria bacterium]
MVKPCRSGAKAGFKQSLTWVCDDCSYLWKGVKQKYKHYYTHFRSLSLLKNSPAFAFYTTVDLFFIA